MHLQARQAQLQQYGDVFIQPNHSVDEHGDMRLDEKSQSFGRKSLIFHILPPISLHRNNFPIKFPLNKILKILKDLIAIRFLFKRI
jgi:hypothetical protein